MEKYRPIPQEEALFSQSEPLVPDESISTMSEREIQDMEWNQQRILNRMRNVQGYTGWHPTHRNYIYQGVGQKRG